MAEIIETLKCNVIFNMTDGATTVAYRNSRDECVALLDAAATADVVKLKGKDGRVQTLINMDHVIRAYIEEVE